MKIHGKDFNWTGSVEFSTDEIFALIAIYNGHLEDRKMLKRNGGALIAYSVEDTIEQPVLDWSLKFWNEIKPGLIQKLYKLNGEEADKLVIQILSWWGSIMALQYFFFTFDPEKPDTELSKLIRKCCQKCWDSEINKGCIKCITLLDKPSKFCPPKECPFAVEIVMTNNIPFTARTKQRE